jgi:hypothetical protein
MNRQQRMLNRLTAAILADRVGPRRAGGGSICARCGRQYYDHPKAFEPGFDGEPSLNRLCNGRLVKL